MGKLIAEDAVDRVALRAGYHLTPLKNHDGGKHVEEKGAAAPDFDEGVDVGDGGDAATGLNSVPKQTLFVDGKNDFKNVIVIGGSIVGEWSQVIWLPSYFVNLPPVQWSAD